MIRRLVGLVIIIVGLGGIILSVIGMKAAPRTIDTIGNSLEANLVLVSESLDTVQETLLLAQSTVGEVTGGLDTVEESAVHVSLTINQTQPLLDQVSTIASDEVPQSLDSIQAAIPDLVQIAAAIDDTLTVLNSFRVDQQILGIPIKFDLGINYGPAVPFDESVSQIGRSFETLPGQLRDLDEYVVVANDNLALISEDVLAISQDLDGVNGRIAELDPLLKDYLRIVVELNDSTRQTRQIILGELNTLKRIVTIALAWVALSQLAPLYLGLELLRGRREEKT
ncbi:MAG: hypothetical protein H6667_24250 [Ardenticatenaceae bacterium]|nr:hypothetical protein [Ardenticatenaceae bacterium]MCB9444907.1 hypothetical protein [Ardenticatenaceae bacterium]